MRSVVFVVSRCRHSSCMRSGAQWGEKHLPKTLLSEYGRVRSALDTPSRRVRGAPSRSGRGPPSEKLLERRVRKRGFCSAVAFIPSSSSSSLTVEGRDDDGEKGRLHLGKVGNTEGRGARGSSTVGRCERMAAGQVGSVGEKKQGRQAGDTQSNFWDVLR